MILLASLLGGAWIGWRKGADARALRVFAVVWLAVFAFQTAFLVAREDNPRNRATGEWDLGYFPFALCVLALGVAVLHGAAALRRRRSRASADLSR